MTFSLDVRLDIKAVERQLTNLQRKQVPFATAKALTITAQEIKKAQENELKQKLKNPTKFTLNSLRVRPAKKRKLESEVLIMDESFKARPPIDWLSPNIHGGGRKHKRGELRLINAGIMRRDEYTVPGQRAKRNRFGNISKGTMQKILSDTMSQFDKYQNTRKRRRKHYYFAEINGQRGIWFGALAGGTAWPILMFVKAPKYRKIIKFDKIATSIAKARFARNFHRTLRHALATAR